MTHPGDLLHAYLDNELDAPRALEVHTHLGGCEACRAELAGAQSAREAVKRIGRDEPSAALLARLRPRRRRVAPYALGATAALALSLLALAFFRPPEKLAHELASAHARALMSARTLDVPSSDRHTVKPFFQGKVPFSLPVADFADQGFTLEGGRIDAVAGHTVAVLVYRHQAHVIDAFAWPDELLPAAPDGVQLGYHLLGTQAQGTRFTLVSDASSETLAQLAKLISAGQ